MERVIEILVATAIEILKEREQLKDKTIEIHKEEQAC